MVILRGLIYLHNALDSIVAFSDYLQVDKMCVWKWKNQSKIKFFGAKNSIEKNLENFDCNICRYIQNLYYISKYTNGHGL